MEEYKDGEPCNHPGCLNHVTHPCEGCGRIAGFRWYFEENGPIDEKVFEDIKTNEKLKIMMGLSIEQELFERFVFEKNQEAEIEGMKAENKQRESYCRSMEYTGRRIAQYCL